VDPFKRLPEGAIPYGFVISIKAIGPEGNEMLVHDADGVTTWEAIGMATSMTDDLRDALRSPGPELEDA